MAQGLVTAAGASLPKKQGSSKQNAIHNGTRDHNLADEEIQHRGLKTGRQGYCTDPARSEAARPTKNQPSPRELLQGRERIALEQKL